MNVYKLLAEIVLLVGLLVGAALAVKGFNETQRSEAVLQDRAVSAEAVVAEKEEALNKEAQRRQEAEKTASKRAGERDAATLKLRELQKGYENDRKDPPVDAWFSSPVPPALRLRRHADDSGSGDPNALVRSPPGALPAAPGNH